MTILNTISLESNKQIKINFNGGDLSSDGGLLLIKEFTARVGLIKLIIPEGENKGRRYRRKPA